jgi:hypothetical protein
MGGRGSAPTQALYAPMNNKIKKKKRKLLCKALEISGKQALSQHKIFELQ